MTTINATHTVSFLWDGIACSLGSTSSENSDQHALDAPPVLFGSCDKDGGCIIHVDNTYYDYDLGRHSYINIEMKAESFFDKSIEIAMNNDPDEANIELGNIKSLLLSTIEKIDSAIKKNANNL